MAIYDILAKIMSYLWVYNSAYNYVELDDNLVPRRIVDTNEPDDLRAHNYVELDHNLVPREIADINEQSNLPGRVKSDRLSLFVKKYALKKDNMKIVLQKFQSLENDTKIIYEAVIGSDEEIWYDHDWGFFSTVLAAYNNHWVLKTSPDDWWNVVVKNVAQVVDEKGDLPNVRDFFVAHQGKKKIEIEVGASLSGFDYSWLFDQFSAQINENVKVTGYVDLIKADFSTTTPQQLITTQIMLMASVQKYFDFEIFTYRCGIPGVDMLGTVVDWIKLVDKLDKLEYLLKPIMNDLEMAEWFGEAKGVLNKLLDTKRGNPDRDWWGHILSWNLNHGSGASEFWSGWFPEFLMAKGAISDPKDFPRGLVSVPLIIEDTNNKPAVSDTGILVAGTVGFTVEEGKWPAVVAKQGWTLLMPVGSPVTPRLRGED